MKDKLELLNEKFDKVYNEFQAELKEANELRKQAKDLDFKARKMAEVVSEKYGMPVTWGREGYVPNSVSVWLDKKKYDEDELDELHDLLGSGWYNDPGEWWQPSRNC